MAITNFALHRAFFMSSFLQQCATSNEPLMIREDAAGDSSSHGAIFSIQRAPSVTRRGGADKFAKCLCFHLVCADFIHDTPLRLETDLKTLGC